MYCICHQVYCRGHHLTLGTTLRCTLGASLRCPPFAKWSAYPIMYIRSLTWCTVYAKMCTEYAIMYIRSFTWCLLHLPSSVLQRPSSNIRNNTEVHFRSLTWVYCIFHQVVCISYHVNQEPHMVYCICQHVY